MKEPKTFVTVSHHIEFSNGELFNEWYVLDTNGVHWSGRHNLRPEEFEELRLKLLTFKDNDAR